MIAVLVVSLGLVGIIVLCTLVHSSAYRRGFEAGCQHQRRLVNQAADKLKAEQWAAERDIVYLYERARSEIRQSGPSGTPEGRGRQ